ncbi:AmmeMemoRadiSam system protein B [bacterium]|nr:AmmeMemoRadiSam system protein B [bacterium]
MNEFPVFPLDTPAVRPVEIVPAQAGEQTVLVVRDPLNVIEGLIALQPDPLLIFFLQFADGQHTLQELATVAGKEFGTPIPVEILQNMAQQLDEALLLFSERFQQKWEERKQRYQDAPTRQSVVFVEEDRLKMMKDLGEELRRHGMSRNSPPAKLELPHANVRAVLSPHIDYQRGGEAYAWAYKAIAEHTRATTFIILGTLHCDATHRFIATRKPFETPLGTVEVDTELLDSLAEEFGGELYAEEYLHGEEHTIELQVVYLQHVLKNRPFKIVPILVSSFEDLLVDGGSPKTEAEIQDFVEALRKVLQREGDRVVLIGGVDFSHCGPQFGDQELNSDEFVQAVGERDRNALKHIEAIEPDAFFEFFRDDANATRVCSIAPIYCLLSALDGDHQAKLLRYDQNNSSDRTCMVSFASFAFMPKAPKIILAT